MKIPPARIVFSGDDRREILALIDESLRSGALTLGPRTRAFEDAFARRHDAEHAVAVASGTAALEIVFRCLDVAGGEVVVPANTFYATAGAVVHAGDDIASTDYVDTLARMPVLKAPVAALAGSETPAAIASATEFVLEGLHLSKRLNKEASGTRATYRGR